MEETISYITCSVNAITSLIILSLNLLILASISRTPKLHSPSNFLLFGLAVSDCGVGLVVQPLFIAAIILSLKQEQSASVLNNVFYVTACSLCTVSFLTITLISVDRFLAIHLHLRYNELVTTKLAVLSQVVLWIVSVLAGSSWLWWASLFYYIAVPAMFVCLLLNAVCYFKIYAVLKRHFTHIGSQPRTQIQQGDKQLDIKRFRKSALTMFLIFVVLLLCYLPYAIAVIGAQFVSRNKYLWRFFELTLTVRVFEFPVQPDFVLCPT